MYFASTLFDRYIRTFVSLSAQLDSYLFRGLPVDDVDLVVQVVLLVGLASVFAHEAAELPHLFSPEITEGDG